MMLYWSAWLLPYQFIMSYYASWSNSGRVLLQYSEWVSFYCIFQSEMVKKAMNIFIHAGKILTRIMFCKHDTVLAFQNGLKKTLLPENTVVLSPSRSKRSCTIYYIRRTEVVLVFYLILCEYIHFWDDGVAWRTRSNHSITFKKCDILGFPNLKL